MIIDKRYETIVICREFLSRMFKRFRKKMLNYKSSPNLNSRRKLKKMWYQTNSLSLSLSREIKEVYVGEAGKKVARERIKRTKGVPKRVVKCNLKKEEASSRQAFHPILERREKKKAES